MSKKITSIEPVARRGGNEIQVLIKTTADATDVERINTKIPEQVKTLQDLVNALGTMAFKNAIEKPKEPSLPCKNLKATSKGTNVSLTWEDPDDDTWASTRIVRKTGGYPTSETDGTIVTTTYIKNQHQSSPFVDSGLALDTTYYYRAFSCSVDGIYNTTDYVQTSVRVRSSTVMTVIIDLSNSNPDNCGSFADDAVTMPYGKTTDAINQWREFFGYKPCLVKDGVVVGYLKANDYRYFEDGGSADITSGSGGDVMVEFPRRGIRVLTDGNSIHVSMTDAEDDPDFVYYAHTRGSVKKDAFYLGCYPASLIGGMLRSLSGKAYGTGKTIGNFRNYAHAHGSGYELMTWYQWMYLQVMYCLQFRGRLDSQTEVGTGTNESTMNSASGGTANTLGLIYGTTSAVNHTKLFGLEDIYSGHFQFVDGCMLDSSGNVLTATDGFNNEGSGYTNRGNVASAGSGYMNSVVGSSELGFFPTAMDGSSSTYFCDFATLRYGCFMAVGKAFINRNNSEMGIFGMHIDYKSNEGTGWGNSSTRLSYY